MKNIENNFNDDIYEQLCCKCHINYASITQYCQVLVKGYFKYMK